MKHEIKKRSGMKRAPRAKAGQLKAQWGKLPDESPDIVYAWGDGCSKRDGALLNYFFTHTPNKAESLLKELEDRGYDIRTLKFSIEKTGDD